jgi:hypothetical protein
MTSVCCFMLTGTGLGALNVCSLEQASPDDGLLPLLFLGGQPVQSLMVFTTQLLPETRQLMLHLLMVRVVSMRLHDYNYQVVLSPSRVVKHSLDLIFKLQSLLLIVPTASTAPQHHRSTQLGGPPAVFVALCCNRCRCTPTCGAARSFAQSQSSRMLNSARTTVT